MSTVKELGKPRPRTLSGSERSLVEALRQFIEENRHPISGVARRLGLRYVTLRKVLVGEQVPQVRTLQLIANYLRSESTDAGEGWDTDSTAWARSAFDRGVSSWREESCSVCRTPLSARARQSENENMTQSMARLLRELKAVLEMLGGCRMPGLGEFGSMEERANVLISKLTETIEEDRVRGYELETVIAQMVGISDKYQLPAEVEETVQLAKSKLRRTGHSREELVAQREALRNRFAILRETDSSPELWRQRAG